MPAVAFFFNDTATTEIYTLSLHDALPILPTMHLAAERDQRRVADPRREEQQRRPPHPRATRRLAGTGVAAVRVRSEEHTSELQSRQYLVCRLLLEKKNTAVDRLYSATMGT